MTTIATLIRRRLESIDGATAEDISAHIGIDRDRVTKSCSALVKRGELSAAKDGAAPSVYSLADWELPPGDEIIADAMSRRIPLELAWMWGAK